MFEKRDIELPKIDAMIPVAEKDSANLPLCVRGLRKHSQNPIGTIYVIGAARLKHRIDEDVEWIDEETVYPTLSDVRNELSRIGYQYDSATWYFQQLLKLCAFEILKPKSRYLLIHDADVLFVGDLVFVDNTGRAQLPYGYPLEWKLGTREHTLPDKHSALSAAQRLVPGWTAVDAYSGMHHHIVLDALIMKELFRQVQTHHAQPFWQAFIGSIEKSKWHGIAEYVIYRHFAAQNFGQLVKSRHVVGIDVIESAFDSPFELEDLINSAQWLPGVKLIGCHKFADYTGTLASMDYIPPDLRETLMADNFPLALLLDDGQLTIEALDQPEKATGLFFNQPVADFADSSALA